MLAGVRRQQPYQRPQRDALARAGFAENAKHLAGFQLEADAVDRADDRVLAL